MEVAHAIVLKEVSKLGTCANSTLYLDGGPSNEKRETQIRREEAREKALYQAKEAISELQLKVEKKTRAGKQMFRNIEKNLRKAYYWPSEARVGFAKFMRELGWDVRECGLEADVVIARDCRPGDIVISRDSDMLVYENIHKIWRPISGGRFLQYDLPGVLATLGINRIQLTALGIVSSNDYNRNIPTLGGATNFSILKSLDGTDVPTIVQNYLSHDQVFRKNVKQESFANSLRVFVNCVRNHTLHAEV
ncbi:hypothetical protein BGX26_003415 [Mortierella sp. AD094]|nr:hypothetical protein BGX26_003415 [Mortierella sp. AD094]